MAIQWKFFVFALILTALSASVNGAGVCTLCDDSSSTDEKCANEPASFEKTCAADKCFSAVANNGQVKRGCVDENTKCEAPECKTCDASEKPCNNVAITFSCKVCDSNSDPNCSQWSAPDSIKSALCDEGVTKCVMNIKEDNHIERRCAKSNAETCANAKTCEVCTTSGCNKDVFPADRRRCYQCDASSKCANPSQNPTEIKSLPCRVYVADDKCLMYGTSETDMGRGCNSDSAVLKACTDAKEKCKTCTTDNCNSNPFKYSQVLKCIQCSADSTDCVWGHDKSEAKNCGTQIEFYQSEACYTNKIADGKAERGCIHDVKDLNCDTTATCSQCDSEDGCNNADEIGFTCYTCRSDETPACAKPLENNSFSAEKCRNPVNANTKGCYIEKWNDIYIRSCLVDADVTTKKQCLDSAYNLCDTCTDKNCNGGKLKNSAGSVALGGSILALCLVVLRFL